MGNQKLTIQTESVFSEQGVIDLVRSAVNSDRIELTISGVKQKLKQDTPIMKGQWVSVKKGSSREEFYRVKSVNEEELILCNNRIIDI